MERLHKFRPKYFFSVVLAAVFFGSVTKKSNANDAPFHEFDSPLTTCQRDTLPPARSIPDSPLINRQRTDTSRLPFDSARTVQTTDTFSLRISKDSLDAPVHYKAEDSAVILVNEKKIILYGQTETNYKDIVLKAPKVEVDQQTQVLTAVYSVDTAGVVLDRAYFKQGENEFYSDTIKFNFKNQKGFSKNTITQSGELFIHAAASKKVDANTTFIKEGEFTTCNLDDPHFAFRANRMKVISQKLAVSGPAHPEFEGVPIPVYLPFGIYPISQGRHSGLLPPQFETNEQMGLGLTGLGYYKVLNDYWDTKVYGNLYSYGSWEVNVNPTYRKRYRYAGSFTLSRRTFKQNFKGDPDYIKNTSYNVSWGHSVDSRARPGVSFSANVNAGSSKFNQYNPNNPAANFQNQLNSSISYSKTWRDKPFNLTVNANHSQNNLTRLISVSLPRVGFTVNTLYPFEKKEQVGTPKWYEKIGIGYNGNFNNQVSFYDTAFRFKNLIDTLQWGAQHSIPVIMSLPPLFGGALIVSPSVNYSQVWIAQKFRRTWNPTLQKVDTTITKGFFTDHTASFGISMNTAIFGTYQFKNSRLVAIRHVIRPTFGLNYRPDLSKKHWYEEQVDASGYKILFSEFDGALFSGFAPGRNGGISFGIDNNLEMKWRSKKDTGENAIRKVPLIDGYGFSTSYNFLADSMKLSPIELYLRTNLFQKISIGANARMDPYLPDSRGRATSRYAWQDGKFNLGRITQGSVSVSTSFESKPKDPKKEEQRKEQIKQNLSSEMQAEQQRLLDYARQNPEQFVDFNIPWKVSLSYALSFQEVIKPDYSGFEKDFSSTLNFNGSFNLTPKWNFGLSGFIDVESKDIQTLQMSITRDMHCWQMSLEVTPVGPFRYFSINISPKASVLQDLRINRTRSFNTFR